MTQLVKLLENDRSKLKECQILVNISNRPENENISKFCSAFENVKTHISELGKFKIIDDQFIDEELTEQIEIFLEVFDNVDL